MKKFCPTLLLLLAVCILPLVSAAQHYNDTVEFRFANPEITCTLDSLFIDIEVRNISAGNIHLGGVSGRFMFDTAALDFPPTIKESFMDGNHSIASTLTLDNEIVWTYNFIQFWFYAPVPNDGTWKKMARLSFHIKEFDECIDLYWRQLGLEQSPITTANENEPGAFLPLSYNLHVANLYNAPMCFDTICNFPPDALDPTNLGNLTDTIHITIDPGQDTIIEMPVVNDPGDKFTNDTLEPTPIQAPTQGSVSNVDKLKFKYECDPDGSGSDEVICRICDQKGLCDQFVLQVTIGGGALPVDLVSFDAVPQDNHALITWATSTEINASHFDVQRSEDGVKFETIGRVKAAGNSTVLQDYELKDYNIRSNQVYYYRLKQVDFDGRSEMFDVEVVRFEEMQHINVVTYPNPTNGIVNVELFTTDNSIEVTESVMLMNALGEVIHEFELSSNNTKASIDISNYAKGIYYLSVRSNNVPAQKRIILQ